MDRMDEDNSWVNKEMMDEPMERGYGGKGGVDLWDLEKMTHDNTKGVELKGVLMKKTV